MPHSTTDESANAGISASGVSSVALGGSNHGTINTGVIVNIHGDDIERNRDIARAVLAATLLAPPLDAARKKAVAAYYRGIAKTLVEAAKELRAGSVPHGKCGEMLYFAQQLPTELGDVIGPAQASALSNKLMESYRVESFGGQFMHLPPADRNAKFDGLDEAAGYFRAAARSLQLRQ